MCTRDADAYASATASNPVDPIPFLHSVPQIGSEADEKRAIRLPSSVEPAGVVRALLYNAAAAGTPMAAHLWLADPSSNTLRLVHAEGPARPDSTPVSIDGTVLGSALKRSIAQIEPVHRLRTPTADAVVWRYALPLTAGDAKGVAAVDFQGPKRPDLERFTPIAGAMRGTLSGALALQVARAEAASARALSDTSRDFARMLDPDDVVTTTLERAMALAGAQTGSVMLLDEHGLMRIVASRGLPLDVVSEAAVCEGEGIAGWVLASRQPLIVEDLNDRGHRSRRHGVRSAVSVPIGDEEGVLGVLNVGNRTFQARFSQSNLAALESLGRSTAVALRNARAIALAHDLYFDTLKALAIAMEAKDPYARGTTDRITDLTLTLGQAMAMSSEELDALRVASLLHDIGMSAAGDVMSVTSRQLSTVEWGMLKMHPVIAAEILAQAPALRDAIPIVAHHHEHFDGGGYTGGLAGDTIPMGARVLAVADAFVAMTSERPYRRAKTPAEAIEILLAESGSQFDPVVVQALVELHSIDSADARDEAV
jgi:response regulator RpfG family c-di-GMP phosphodiesterase